MGEHTEIQWTDHTFNPWWGCTRVSEACQNCYAESLAKRFGTGWGKGADRRMFGDKHWNDPVRWNRKAERAGKPETVFCASMADVFEDRPELVAQRERLWELIGRSPWLTWQLLTKRPENVMGMVPPEWATDWPANVWAGCTVENQRWADERLPIIAKVPALVTFGSFEPLFGMVDLSRLPIPSWVIAGGESGRKARPSHPDWFRSLRDQCERAKVPFLFKQWGEWLSYTHSGLVHADRLSEGLRRSVIDVGGREMDGEAPCDPARHPSLMLHVGKKAAGRTLDGRTWDEMPPLSVPACP